MAATAAIIIAEVRRQTAIAIIATAVIVQQTGVPQELVRKELTRYAATVTARQAAGRVQVIQKHRIIAKGRPQEPTGTVRLQAQETAAQTTAELQTVRAAAVITGRAEAVRATATQEALPEAAVQAIREVRQVRREVPAHQAVLLQEAAAAATAADENY